MLNQTSSNYPRVCHLNGNAATMFAAFTSICILAVATAAAAAGPPLNIVGEGLLSSPPVGKPGVKYAGPIVYSNEKPPIIYFPPPPKDAKPGFVGGFGPFGKNKSPKSIKYVPMPHHDLPVLIYTSDKTPPIHVVQPPNPYGAPSSPSLSSFGPPKDDFGPPIGSLSSTYRVLPAESTSSRIISSSYEIPGTPYGSPMSAFRGPPSSIESFDFQSTAGSSHNEVSVSPSAPSSFGPPVLEIEPNSRPSAPFGVFGQNKNKPPHVVYSGHPPIHVFNEPDMFVRAPKEIPLKTYYEDMPPKASFGPPKQSFGHPSTGNHFAPLPPSSHRLSFGPPTPSSFRSVQASFFPPRENLVSSASSTKPVSISLGSPQADSPPHHPTSPPHTFGGGPSSHYGGPPSYSINPSYHSYSFGPFSVEYGPPSEPLVSFSEPTGSLTSIYDQMSDVGTGPGGSSDGWISGPPPSDTIKDDAWNHPLPTSGHGPHFHHGPPPNPMHNSVLLPPHHHHHHHPSPFGASKLAHLFSTLKLKRNKPKYAIAPKSMHKPPIIIYYGKKPPVHVYQQSEDEHHQEAHEASSSSSSVTVTSPADISSLTGEGRFISNEQRNIGDVAQKTSIENTDLSYGGSQKSEVRVAAPVHQPSQQQQHVKPAASESKPMIIPARPVDIYSQADLRPSIYMARNSLNTIYVSDLNGSGTRAIKTYVVRQTEDDRASASAPKMAVAQASIFSPYSGVIVDQDNRRNNNNNGVPFSIPIAQNRISGVEQQAIAIPQESKQEVPQVELSEALESESARGPTIFVLNPAVAEEKVEAVEKETEENEQQPGEEQDEQTAESQEAPVAIIQSPSSFQQTSLSQAEKDASESAETADIVSPSVPVSTES